MKSIIQKSGAKGAVTLHNKSCKCDFVSAKDISIPQAELEVDMIDRHFAVKKGLESKFCFLRRLYVQDRN